MKREDLRLSKDQTQLLDLEGNVKFVAQTDKKGEEYFIEPDKLTRDRACAEWDTIEVCVGWNDFEVCISWTTKRVCVG